jgi:hypothetical protein
MMFGLPSRSRYQRLGEMKQCVSLKSEKKSPVRVVGTGLSGHIQA